MYVKMDELRFAIKEYKELKSKLDKLLEKKKFTKEKLIIMSKLLGLDDIDVKAELEVIFKDEK